MNKSDLINSVAGKLSASKADVGRFLDTTLDEILAAVARHEEVVLTRFGTFGVKYRPERTGRNPQTGQPITIEAAHLPVFKAGKALKDAAAQRSEEGAAV